MNKHANVAIFLPHAGCPHRCSFCNQNLVLGESELSSPEKVEEILRSGLQNLGENVRGAQIAFFGGSFTAMPEDYRISLLETASRFIGENGYSGVRISTRPDYIDKEIIAQLKYYTVNAVELGVQSMDAGVLAANDRGHTPEDVRKASEMISSAGISLGHQMMTGLYTSSPEKDMYTAKELAALGPDTVRIFPTLVLRGTKLAALYEKGLYVPYTLEESVDICAGLLGFFIGKGIEVIKLGLHGGGASGDEAVAGVNHPAFRELCEGKIFLDKIIAVINEKKIPPGKIALRVNTRDVSKAVGQKKCNINHLNGLGYSVKIIDDDSQGYLDVNIV